MKTSMVPLGLLTAFLTTFAVVGCNGSNAPETAVGSESPATTNVAAEDGCCGKCQTEDGAAQDGCCGKCSESSEASAKGCSEGCNACAEGKSESCQCGDCPASNVKTDAATPNAEAAEHDGHVNSNREDRDIFHYLLQKHEKISRTVKNIENGVETITESQDAEVVKKIQEHVASMHGRIKDVRRLRMWDDLFVEIFKHADEIEMKVTNTKQGVKVVETSDNPKVVKLIQQHAVVVSGFSKYGFDEARKNHPVTEKKADAEVK